jgi:hypothetical protein
MNRSLDIMKPQIKEDILDTAKQKIASWIDKSIRYMHDNWDNFREISKREKKETIVAVGILKDMILGYEITDNEKKFLKSQSKDVVKILLLISIKFIPSPIPFTPIAIFLGKKVGINVLPTAQPHLPYRS